jgi:hypothetical protein
MSGKIINKVNVPTNEEFVQIVEDYFKRFPSVCGGNLWTAGIVVSNYYRDEGVDVTKQYEYFITKMD